jgi:putative flippase GtrA
VTAYLRSFMNRESAGQALKLALIGVANTAVHLMVLNVLLILDIGDLNVRATVAFTVATAVSYILNRRWTFRIKHDEGLLRETVPFFAINVVALLVTLGVVNVARVLWGDAAGNLSAFEENAANLAAGLILVLPKLAGYRDLVFRRSLATSHAEPQPDGVAPHLPEGPGGDTAP